jgi:RHH-type transcriptional regulator, proline utilization regulon repressor / proline dehydrogenase / delta 1-pyrroline-5-carboxylate dehydrogenase
MVVELDLDTRVFEIGSEIIGYSKQYRPHGLSQEGRRNKVFEACMKDPYTQAQLLRFIDVFSTLNDDEDIVRHMDEYLDPDRIDLGFMGVGRHLGNLVSRVSSRPVVAGIRYFANEMASSFIGGGDIEKAAGIVEDQYRKDGMGFSLDTLGEGTISEIAADQYMGSYFENLRVLGEKFGEDAVDEFGSPIINVSIKVSSLYSKFDPIDQKGSSLHVRERLRPIFRRAKEIGAFVHVDSEEYAVRDTTFGIIKDLLMEDEFRDYNAGIVIQAYLKDSEQSLDDFIQWSQENEHPLTIRLVKGAYWDYEVMTAQRNGWDVPVFTEKWQTDANHEKLARKLIDNIGHVNAAVATHNIRTISNALAYKEYAQHRGAQIGTDQFEVQMLYGMGNEIKKALVQMDVPVRVYTPFGDLISGMGYFVRRLLENSSNYSFLRAFDANSDPKLLLQNPLTVGSAGGANG